MKERVELVKEQLILTHPLIDFEIQKCYQNEPKSNGVYSNIRHLRHRKVMFHSKFLRF